MARLLLLPLLPLLCALLLGAPAASAATGPCRPGDDAGPTCQIDISSVPRKGGVNDGDTIDANVRGRREHVRFLGVQAMELTRYSVTPSKRRGECHALAATNLVERVMRQGGYRVRLAAQAPRRDAFGRLLRFVAVRVDGRWRDVGEMLMARGLTLWLHNTVETTFNRRYNLLGQRAAAKGIGLFNPTACGAGPSQDVPVRVWAMSDPVGDDSPDTEYMRVQNLSGTATLSLTGWHLSDAGPKPIRFRFPAGTKLGPGQTLTVFTGRGTSSGSVFYRGLKNTQFENSANGGDAGDGVYLFDPKGDLRAHLIYPCLVACSDPLQGAVEVVENADRGPEYVLVRNVSDNPFNLYGYQLRLPGAYAFGPESVLQPGETMQIFVRGEPSDDTRLTRHIGYDGPYLPDSGGRATVSTFDEIVLGCDSWGNGSC